MGTKGVFIKELEDALLDRRVDLAVHSMKDLPTEMPAGLTIAAICKREDVRDALLSSAGATLESLPQARAWAPAACAGNRNCFTRETICACSNFAGTWIRELKS